MSIFAKAADDGKFHSLQDEERIIVVWSQATDVTESGVVTSSQLPYPAVVPSFNATTVFYQKTRGSLFWNERHVSRPLDLFAWRVCVSCDTGNDIAAGIVLLALQLFFGEDGEYCGEKKSQVVNKKSLHTRLERIISDRPEVNPSRSTLKRINEFLLTPQAGVSS
ncbi:hypothetical protein BDZ89DRAFT_1146988 [Hymenopellis radicata]|nr:hypothetical protein BDZ89DRAFT_1146988 [Hymenopellis radicata]